MGYIYLRTNKINGKKYVGQVITRRFKERQYKWTCLSQPYSGEVINRARAKYGIDAFDFEILKECEDDELDYWEKYYIKELNTKIPYGYNMTDGGDGKNGCPVSEETKKKLSEANKGKHLSEEAKLKISEANKGKQSWNKGKTNIFSEETKKKMSDARKGIKLSEETKKKISEKMKGENNSFYGKHHSEEAKLKMSEAHKGKQSWSKGKHCSEETRKKISEARKGRKHTEEIKKKISEKLKGEKNPNYGKHHTEEFKKKIRKAVLQLDKGNNEIIKEWSCAIEVEKELGIKNSNICKCCKGKRKTCGGYIWRYKEESIA